MIPAMKKRAAVRKELARINEKRTGGVTPSREYIHSLRGRLHGKGLMKALMAEKKQEREL